MGEQPGPELKDCGEKDHKIRSTTMASEITCVGVCECVRVRPATISLPDHAGLELCNGV